MSAVSLANGGDQSKRRELDYYPTPPEATHALMQFLEMKGILKRDSLVWGRPAAMGPCLQSFQNTLMMFIQRISATLALATVVLTSLRRNLIAMR